RCDPSALPGPALRSAALVFSTRWKIPAASLVWWSSATNFYERSAKNGLPELSREQSKGFSEGALRSDRSEGVSASRPGSKVPRCGRLIAGPGAAPLDGRFPAAHPSGGRRQTNINGWGAKNGLPELSKTANRQEIG